MGRVLVRCSVVCVLADGEEVLEMIVGQRFPRLIRRELDDAVCDLLEGAGLLDVRQPVAVSVGANDIDRGTTKLFDGWRRRGWHRCRKFNDDSQWKLLSVDDAKNGYNIIIA